MTFSFSSIIPQLTHVYDQALSASSDTVGRFGTAYDIILGLISNTPAGQPLLQIVPGSNGAPAIIEDNRTGLPVDLDNFRLSLDYKAALTPIPGVAPAAWAFLWGAVDVNRNEGEFSAFIRDYTAAEYKLRFGDNSITDAQLTQKEQMASNAIGQSLMEDILDLTNPGANPNHNLPALSTMANDDAQGAARLIFTSNQIAGWAGNPLFILLGDNASYNQNILHGASGNPDTGDALSVIDAMKSTADALGVTTDVSLIYNIATKVLPNAGGLIELASNALNLSQITDNFLNRAYGTSGMLTKAIFDKTHIDLTTGDHTFQGTDKNDLIREGSGNNTIVASAGNDFIDGGPGANTVSYAPFVDGVKVTYNLREVS